MPRYLLHARFLLGLFFNPEDGGYICIRNVGWFSADYTALYYKRTNINIALILFQFYHCNKSPELL
jgi:hypothetical protein